MKLKPTEPIRVFPNEEFKELFFEDNLKLRYDISNKGRIISFKKRHKIWTST
jgi:hypothetical protein